MRSESVSDREAVLGVLGLSFDAMTDAEKLALQNRMERNLRRAPVVEHRLVGALAAETEPQALGGTSLTDVLATRLRISKREASRRITEAADLGPRTAFTGEPLEPVLPHTAAAQQRGEIGAEHVKIIRSFFHQLPASVDYQTRELAEADLARLAAGLKPEELRQVADRLMMLVHPDGDFSDAERARRRHLTIGKQDADGMSKISGLLDPETRATLDAVLAKWAAPACATPTTRPRVWTRHPPPSTNTAIPVVSLNATTTPSTTRRGVYMRIRTSRVFDMGTSNNASRTTERGVRAVPPRDAPDGPLPLVLAIDEARRHTDRS